MESQPQGSKKLRRGHTNVSQFALTAALIGLSLSGCRVGNHVEPSSQAVAQSNPDKISGYYETQPQHLNYCATVAGQVTCSETTVNNIPAEIAKVMTNPVILVMSDLNSGAAEIVDTKTNRSYLPVTALEDGTLSMIGMGNPGSFFGSTECFSQLFVKEVGSFNKNQGSGRMFGDHEISGRIQLSIKIVETLQGNCTDWLTALRDCYADETKCGGKTPAEDADTQNQIQSIFGPYIDAQALTIDQIPDLSVMTYEVVYE